jgi:Reverse transcriptase (RNA-dependent DNA polymerase)/Integrase core domain/GAG-pre-integrase domain
LVSVGRLDEAGFTVIFGGGKCVLRGEDDVEIGVVPRTSTRVYKVEHEEAVASAAEERLTLDKFHRRMGHISLDAARKLVKDNMITGVRLEYTPSKNFFCASCVYAKATRKSVPKLREGARAEVFGGEVHSDLWGKAPVESRGGKKYYVTFIDDKTRLTHLYLLKTKDETAKVYKQYEAWVETQMGAKIKVLNTDRGGEYQGEDFVNYLKSKGTHQKLNVHDTPQHAGVAERRNRTIGERIRALLHASGLPKFLWGEAARHVVWLLNRTTTKAIEGMTPFEAAFGKKPDLKGVREWGEKVYVRTESGTKLGGRVREGKWLGVDDESKGARVYWPDSKTVTVERNIYFDNSSANRFEEEEAINITKNIVNPPAIINQPVSDAPDTSDAETVEKRMRKPTKKIADLLKGQASWSTAGKPKLAPGVQQPTIDWTASVEECEEEYAFATETSNAEALEPRNLAEAQRRPDWPLWEKAIYEELANLKAAGTWEVVDSPVGVNVVGSKWVFRAKKDAAGNVIRYKARLVAQGFSQVPGVDYFDTFAPVARLASIRTVLAFAASEDYETGQIDIKSAYLNGELTEDEVIFMRQAPGYEERGPDGSAKVLRLRKSLYGLKQAGRRWYQKLVFIMTKLGFSRCEGDQAVFYRRCEATNVLIVVLVHVDDCSIVGKTKALVARFKVEIAKFVDITDMGELHWILGIEVRRIREERRILLSQKSYIDSILRRYGFDDLKPVSTPMDPNTRLTSAQSPSTTEEFAAMRNVPYHEAVGSLMYATLGTRPDICFAVQTVSRFNSKPGLAHWEAVKRIFRYLKGTKDLWLGYGGAVKELVGYADADGSMSEDRKAVSGYAFLINGGAVSWSAKRQEIISLSTTESEYVAATYAAKEALWLRQLISQLFGINLDATTLFSDNQSAIALTKEHQYHARTKHIDVRFHFIRWIIEDGKLRLIYCPTNEMVADILTKALVSAKVKHFASELGLVSS